MAFFDKVKEVAVSAAHSTGDKIEVAKVNMEIRSEENKVQEVLASIGKVIYGKYESGIVKDEEVLSLCKEIDEIMEEIQELKEKTLELKDKKSCVNCGKELDAEDMFCKACGTKQPEKTDKVNDAPEEQEQNEDTVE